MSAQNVKLANTPARMDMAKLIQLFRQRTGLTQEQFAARLGVTFPTINRWENGRTQPSRLALMQIRNSLRELGDQGRDLLEEFLEKPHMAPAHPPGLPVNDESPQTGLVEHSE